VISIEELSYEVGTRTILDKVSFTVGDGDRVAIVGPNGAGKSTLLKIILEKLDPTEGRIVKSKSSGTIGFMPQHLGDLGPLPRQSVLDFMLSGRNLDTLTETINRKLGEMEQTGLSQDEYMRLAREYSLAFDQFMANGGYDAEGELLDILLGMSLTGLDLDQDVQTLSGGQKTKLAFARVLFSRPQVMVLDEPTNHLDEQTINWAVEFLKKFSGTLVMVSHIPSVLDELVNRIVYLDGSGKASIFKGNFTEFQKKKLNLDIAQEKLRREQEGEAERLSEFIEKWRGKKPKLAKDREKKLERLRDSMVDAPVKQAQISITFPVSVQPVKRVLEVRNIHKAFGGNKVLHGVDIDFFRGERVAIMGPNGAGKSTLLKVIAGKLDPDVGKVTFGDRVDVGYYAQEHESLDTARTVLEEMMSVRGLNQSRARSILSHFLFQGDRVATRVGSLSLGERSRLALAKLVASGHNLLLLDEPTNHLDVFAREQVKMALREYEGTVLIISHDSDFLEGIGVEQVLLLPEHKFGLLGQI
jgi:ATPase subunit of ABC transporter with duplicated ATPase domains